MTETKSKRLGRPAEPVVTIRFTGAAGGSLYTAENGRVVLRPGDTIERPLAGHWRVLVDSGDAEVVE